MPSAFTIDPDQFSEAIIKQNSLKPCDGVIMTRDGVVKSGYCNDPEMLCMLIPGAKLGRMLSADGLSSYTVKELKQWIKTIDLAPLQAIVDAAVQQSEG